MLFIPRYGSEYEVGIAVNAKIAQGVITRDEFFITSKVGPYSMQPNNVRNIVQQSLNRMNITYVDLYMLHWPMIIPENPDFGFLDSWAVLEQLVDEGLIRSLGVSNFNSSQIDRLIDNSRIKPVMNQIESHPHCLNKRLIAHCQSRDVVVNAFSPLGAPGHPDFSPGDRLAINEPIIRAVAQRHQRTPAQIMIRYQLQNGRVTIPKTVTHDRVITNFDVFNFNLSDQDIRDIESIGFFSVHQPSWKLETIASIRLILSSAYK